MEEKHYTPDIEDLCVGYEYEIELPTGWMNKKSVWQKFVIREGEDFPSFYKDKRDKIRVPYLKKEQIESFGFNFVRDILAPHYELGDYSITYFPKDKELIINLKDIDIIYQGKCRCINDFRKILKLLEIK